MRDKKKRKLQETKESQLRPRIITGLILAIKTARQRGVTFSHLIRRRYWAGSVKPVIYSLLAGIFLGLYLLTWAGALIFVLLISIYFVIQFIIDHLRYRPTGT